MSDINPQISMRVSNDGGTTYGNWMDRGIGLAGNYINQVKWYRLGQARSRVYQIRYTGAAPLRIIEAHIEVALDE